MALDYVKILELIKRKRLVEETSDPFNPRDAPDFTFFDLEKEEEEKRIKEEMELERYLKK